ncbi:MAG: 23S rRNA (guanosine(2251)-2'-O)-methyltransferase RlmB [Clostridia bacterium]|nr:23S rRNA (guanosine(2251)-2'-O)-methyltransferase RlmB [Clostridia bacterium]
MPHREAYKGKADGGRGKPYTQDRREHEEVRAPERGFRESAPAYEPEAENLLVGRNPIREALKAGRDMEKLLVAKGELMGSAREIVATAREQHVVVQEVDRARLDAMAPNHQGMIAVVSAYAYRTLEDIFALAAERKEAPFIVVLDGITDPHNLGAIIRSAECAGAHGVIIPSRRAVGLTPSAVKASAGAVEHIPVVRETNLSRTLEALKKEGCWVFGTAMNGKNYRSVDYSGPVALVIGSEGEGMSKLVSEHCDDMVTIPLYGKIDSLNASVAAGIILFAIAEGRGGK